jgi:hypothetical protein
MTNYVHSKAAVIIEILKRAGLRWISDQGRDRTGTTNSQTRT